MQYGWYTASSLLAAASTNVANSGRRGGREEITDLTLLRKRRRRRGLWGWGAHPPPGQGRQGQGAKAERRLLAPPSSSSSCSECAPPPSTSLQRPVEGCTIYTLVAETCFHSDTRHLQSASALMSMLISFPLPKNHAR